MKVNLFLHDDKKQLKIREQSILTRYLTVLDDKTENKFLKHLDSMK